MKKSQIILFAISLVLSGIIYTIVRYNKKAEIKESKGEETMQYIAVQVAENESRSLVTNSYGQISPYTVLDIAFEVQGRLEKGALEMKPGSTFKFNELLYKVNSEEMYYTLSARKAQLSNLLIAILPDIELDYTDEFDKWQQFIRQIIPTDFLPPFPTIISEKEKMFITSKGVMAEYLNIKSSEARMSKYIFLAPFNGYVVDVYSEPGSIINPGGRIARVSNIDDMEVRLPIPTSLFNKFKEKGSVVFFDSDNEAIGTGKMIRTSSMINSNTQSIDLFYSIQPFPNKSILSGQYVTAEIDNLISEKMCVVPTTAVKNDAVYLLKNHKLVQKKVNVIGSKQDSLFIDGLQNQDTLLLEYMDPNEKIKKYIGIERQK